MKKVKFRKKRHNKPPKDPPISKHIRHERIGNFQFYGEEIVKDILSKIISLSITQQNTNRIYSQLPSICCTHISKEITSFIQQNFISYEHDDFLFQDLPTQPNPSFMDHSFHVETISKFSNTPSDNQSLHHITSIIPYKNIYFDYKYEKENFWGDITQPNPTLKDRAASTQIEYIKYMSPPEHNDIDNKVEDIHSGNKIVNDKSNRFSFKKQNSSSSISFMFNNNTNGNNANESKKKIPLMNLPCYDIPKEKLHLIKELPEITELRIEREKQLKQKEEEIKKLNEMEGKEIEKYKTYTNVTKGNKNKNKKIITNFSTDSKGEIVSIKTIPLDQLVMEFSFAKYHQKEIKQMSNSYMVKRKSIQLQSKINNIKEDESSPPSKSKLTFQDAINKVNNLNGILQQSNIASTKPIAYRVGIKKEIAPCGSLFDLMKPEVGVTIHEDSKTKTGGKDFYKKYNRISLEHYKQTFQNTFYRRSSSTVELSPINIKHNNNIISINTPPQYKINNNDLGTHHKQTKKDSISFQGHSLKKANSVASIVMANHKFSSIASAIDNLDLLNEKDELMSDNEENKDMLKSQNLFENMRKTHYKRSMSGWNKDNKKKEEFNEINTFTKTLINSKQWGKIGNYKEKMFYLPKQNEKAKKKFFQREISLHISNIKMPRDRIKQSAQEVLMNNTMKYFNRKKLLQKNGSSFNKMNHEAVNNEINV